MVGHISLEERVDKDFSFAHRKALLGRIGTRLRRDAASDGDRIPTLLGEAAFADPTEEAHWVTKVLGRITYYRATVLRPESGAA